jgi:hypothetical protein
MKRKKIISKLLTMVVVIIATFQSVGQTNLGASCGCPSIAARASINMSTLPGYNPATGELDFLSKLLKEFCHAQLTLMVMEQQQISISHKSYLNSVKSVNDDHCPYKALKSFIHIGLSVFDLTHLFN